MQARTVFSKFKEVVVKALIWAGTVGMQQRADRDDQGSILDTERGLHKCYVSE